MTIENMTFLGEEIILQAEKIEQKERDAFADSVLPQDNDILTRFKVIKVGKKQLEYKEGDYVLINKNGLPKEIKIEGVGTLTNTYSIPTAQRIYCKLDE